MGVIVKETKAQRAPAVREVPCADRRPALAVLANVFAVAERLGLRRHLTDALGGAVAVATIGPVCAAALRARGVTPSIWADKGTMGALVHAIAEHVAREGTGA
jgi:hypothetical protein